MDQSTTKKHMENNAQNALSLFPNLFPTSGISFNIRQHFRFVGLFAHILWNLLWNARDRKLGSSLKWFSRKRMEFFGMQVSENEKEAPYAVVAVSNENPFLYFLLLNSDSPEV